MERKGNRASKLDRLLLPKIPRINDELRAIEEEEAALGVKRCRRSAILTRCFREGTEARCLPRRRRPPSLRFIMDRNMKQLQEALVDIETDAEQLLLARHQLVENDRMRNASRDALTALRKRARTTKTSVPSPFEIIMKEMEGTSGKQLVKEICPTCGNHNPKEHTWLTFPGSVIFARVPFHVAHTVLDKDQERLDYDTKKLQSFVKEKSFVISEKGALADKISPGIVKSLVSLADKPR
ncbi:hypothetical protein ACQ4PT_037522 [Festuca glaucescens]